MSFLRLTSSQNFPIIMPSILNEKYGWISTTKWVSYEAHLCALIWSIIVSIAFTFKRRVEFEIKHNSKNQGSMGKVFSDGVLTLGLLTNCCLWEWDLNLYHSSKDKGSWQFPFFIKKKIIRYTETGWEGNHTEIIQHYYVQLVHLDFFFSKFSTGVKLF